MHRIRPHVSYANVAATLALLFAMSGGAIAATGGFTAASSSIKACVNGNGVLKLLTGKKCKKGDRAVSWNQSGPAGPAGAQGSAGTQGATGATGTTGLQGRKGDQGPSESGPAAALMTGGSTEGAGVESAGGGGFIVGSGKSKLGDESNNVVASGIDTTARNLFVTLSEPPTSPFTNTPGVRIILYVNHSPTSLSCAITAPATTCSNTSDGASVPAGATLSILVETLNDVTEIPLVTFGYDLASE